MINRLLGIIASKIGITRNTLSFCAAFERSRSRGVDVATVIDIGASDGRWSLLARNYFPDACCFLIEAQECHKAKLERMAARTPRIDFIIAAAGDRQGHIFFNDDDPFGGVASSTPLDGKMNVVPMVKVDDEVERRNLQPPFLLKLDTHGFEVPILNGAVQTLASASMVIIEAYNFRLNPGSLKFHEICAFMEERRFSCVDMVDPMHRHGDKALWQMDLVFIPSNNAVFSSNSYLPQRSSG